MVGWLAWVDAVDEVWLLAAVCALALFAPAAQAQTIKDFLAVAMKKWTAPFDPFQLIDNIYYVGTEPGKPIRVTEVPKVKSVKLLRTGKAVDYSYKNGVLTLPNPDAGPDGLHEVIEVVF